MSLNKLDNFIKNTEGRILYVSPSDLDATDSIDNTGNSLARPFKTIQRALIESARFSYVRGNSNDLIEKTTILLMPGEYIIDNRPGFRVKNVGGQAKVVSPSGAETFAVDTLKLDLNTNFDLTQEDNILYKFNSVNGGVIVPRGTSIVGLDLRKTKVRPLYVPNPTDSDVNESAIFRITGACYFWQFSFFDGNESGTVYTDPIDFSVNNKSKPIFSHHKLTCFEYADGVNDISGYDLTDLDMYYAKLSNAYGSGSGSPNRNIDSKYPEEPDGFAKQRPEWEIVGAFATDPISISTIESGEGGTPSNRVTVTTNIDHGLSVGTPIKIRGVSPEDYNVSTKVQSVDENNPKVFTYLLPTFRKNLTTPGNESGATVTIETDTVSGASPYIFNISLRSVYGMNGMHADGNKASGFRSMVVAQFTGVSLQKDDRAFVKYNKTSRQYNGINIIKQSASDLSNGSSATNPTQIYHLDDEAIYRNGWEQTHIKMSNDAIIQIVSVFAIGFNKHFACESGGDASITNSNSNFGQISLSSDGFKREAFDKDNKAFITNVIPPRAIVGEEENIDWLSIDVGVTTTVGVSTHLYLRGFTSEDDVPPNLTQGYRVGAKVNDKIFASINDTEYEANILMQNAVDNSFREFDVTAVANSKLTIGVGHGLKTGEKVVIISDNADYPENITPHIVYYVIAFNTAPDTDKIQLASTKTEADNGNPITIYGGTNLKIISRVTDKLSGEAGHPVQFDESESRWYLTVNSGNQIYTILNSLGVSGIGVETDPTYIKRIPDDRSLDEKIYKFRVVIPKELENGKMPESGFVIQESSTTGVRDQNDFTLPSITINDYEYNKNPRFIADCSHVTSTSTVRTELPHNLEVGDTVIIRNVTDTVNTSGQENSGYNGTFTVATVPNNMEFTYTNTQSPGSFTNDTSIRNESLPRFERNDLQSNFYIYRNEIINDYVYNQQDGVYHIYALKADATIEDEFTNLSYSQNVTDFYPQLDRDNINDTPKSTKTRALSSPIGEVYTSDLKGSITKETADAFISKLTQNLTVDSTSTLSGGISTITFKRPHRFNGIVTGTLTPGTGTRTNGTYYNVKLFNDSAYTSWNGATAKVIVSGNAITSFQIQSPGSGYSDGNELYFDNSEIGGNQDGKITLSTVGIITAIGDVVQFTGISTISDSYYRIADVPNSTKISIAKTSGDPDILENHIAIHVGPSISIDTTTFSSGITTINCSSAHGLVAGNKFRIIDTNNNNLGDFIVKSRVGVNTFEVETESQLVNPNYILRHYFSSNSGSSDRSDENLAKRGQVFYDRDSLKIDNSGNSIGINTTLIPVTHPSSGIGTTERFPIGSYVQVDNEIMRVSSSFLSGGNKLNVIRGVLSSQSTEHDDGSLIRKIKPIPVEFRRPSIIRASGHTFEYLGYGPGNYSTGLPQIQTRTLTEREEFLSQSQERSAGIVVYTGMNNRGDFYIGNTKKSSATGEERSFDTPIPTVTGENPARLSAIFDEVTVKERIVVEGGDSGEILSQFDGPVTFNNNVRIKNNLSVTGKSRILDITESTSTNSGALIIDGGVGIAKNLNIGGNLFLPDSKSLYFGDDNDLEIYHNGTNSFIDNDTGNLYIRNNVNDDDNSNIYIQAKSGENGIVINDDGSVELYYDNAKKLETTSTGVNVTGTVTATTLSGNLANTLTFATSGIGITGSATYNNSSAVTFTVTSDATDSNIASSIVARDSSGNFSAGTITATLSGTATTATNVDIQGASNTGTYRIALCGGTTGNNRIKSDAGLTYDANENDLFVGGDITAFYSSDERLKENVTLINDPLAKVLSLSGYTFDWNDNSHKEGSETGVIAQEVESLGLPGIVTTRDNGYKAVRYEKLVPLLIESIKELSSKVDSLEQKLNDK